MALDAYRALVEAVGLLPRGPDYLKQASALLPRRPAAPQAATQRPADDFTMDELATMPETGSVLTSTGWVVAAPLLPHVDTERSAQGPGSTDVSALRAILRRKAAKLGQSELQTELRELGALKKRVSLLRARARARAAQPAVTAPGGKVPPDAD